MYKQQVKSKQRELPKKRHKKPAAITIVCSIYIFVELLKNLSSAPMNQIKIATILLFFEASQFTYTTLRYETLTMQTTDRNLIRI